MSTPETPCLPTCLWRESAATLGHWIIVRHADGCDNAKTYHVAPKAEAPPAPVSEPPWVKEATGMAFDALERAYLALKAQNATLTVELERVKGDYDFVSETMSEQVATLTAERDKFESESEQKGADLMACEGMLAEAQAELARLRAAADRVVKHRNKHYRDVRETVDALESVLARSLRAAREGKSNA